MQTANLKMKLLEQQNNLSKLKKTTNQPEQQFESKFLEWLDADEKNKDKTPDKDKAVKLPENHSIVDPMAKFHNNKATLSYAEQLLLISDQTE